MLEQKNHIWALKPKQWDKEAKTPCGRRGNCRVSDHSECHDAFYMISCSYEKARSIISVKMDFKWIFMWNNTFLTKLPPSPTLRTAQRLAVLMSCQSSPPESCLDPVLWGVWTSAFQPARWHHSWPPRVSWQVMSWMLPVADIMGFLLQVFVFV